MTLTQFKKNFLATSAIVLFSLLLAPHIYAQEVISEQEVLQYDDRYHFVYLLNQPCPFDDAQCMEEATASKIRVYEGDTIIQELDIYEVLINDIYTLPIIVDFNFDGNLDLIVPGPSSMAGSRLTIPHLFWLYNPETQLFEFAPEALQDSEVKVDNKHKVLYEFWRGGADSYSTTLYSWNADGSINVKTYNNYLTPIKRESNREPTFLYYDPLAGEITSNILIIENDDGTFYWEEDQSKYDFGCGDTAGWQLQPRLLTYVKTEGNDHVVLDLTLEIQPANSAAIRLEQLKTEVTTMTNREQETEEPLYEVPYYDEKLQNIQWVTLSSSTLTP